MTGTLHIVLAMKPIEGNFVQNALKHGVAGINVDGCRVEGTVQSEAGSTGFGSRDDGYKLGTGRRYRYGRWPSNVILEEGVASAFPESSTPCGSIKKTHGSGGLYEMGSAGAPGAIYDDSGSAARFFKQVKG